jgi:hypothetical protein
MPSVQKPAQLEIGGKTYLLVFDFEALSQVEEQTGVSLLFGIDWRSLTLKRLEGILLASLRQHQPGIQPAEVRSLIRPANIGKIETALIDAWFLSAPDREDGEDPQTPQA